MPFTKLLQMERIPFNRYRKNLKYVCHLADEVQEFLDRSKRIDGRILARLYNSDTNDKTFLKVAMKTITYWNKTMNTEFTKAMKVASHFACGIRSINTDINLMACVFR
ncbi:unnamed protein product [Cylicocyclus nassatus]|uniref:Uncharacterized protein n=1 Tax=Cylicocyclus nassatus TaxID=53992 RepID=A0AA36GM08_CYLNA|nr:unnamed protein product [Cylicocyclus nassatus]